MAEFNIFKFSENTGKDYMRLDLSAKKFKGTLSVLKFIDKDTNQIVLYVPALETSAYGEVESKAIEMLKSAMGDFFDHLLTLSSKNIESELTNLGWKQNWLKNKEYSKAYVDMSGELKNLNAVEDKVEMLTLETA